MKAVAHEPEVRCRRCNHPLTDPVWKEVGYGMECFKWMVKRKWTYWECREELFRLLGQKAA